MQDFSDFLDAPDAPLNVRNNNPGNMRAPAGEFQQFDTPEDGLDAMKHDLAIKISGHSKMMASKYGKDYTPTLTTVISTWAPPSENDTHSYIQSVAKNTGIDPHKPLSVADINRILPAMVKQEGGSKAADYFNGTQTADAGNVQSDANSAFLNAPDAKPKQDFSDFLDGPDNSVPNPSHKVGIVGDMVKGFTAGAFHSLPDLTNDAAALGNLGLEKLSGGKRTFTDFQQVGQQLNDKILPTYTPQTGPGRYAQAAGQFVGAVPAFGGVGGTIESQIGRAAGSGIGSEGGKDLGGAVGGAPGAVIGSLAGAIGGAYSPELAAKVGSMVADTAGGVKAGLGTIKQGFNARDSEALDQAANQMKAQSSASYKKAFNSGAILTDQAKNKILSAVDNRIMADGKLHKVLHGDTMDILQDTAEVMKKPDVSLEELDQQRRLLSSVIKKNLVSNPEDAHKAGVALKALDDTVESMGGADIRSQTREALDVLAEAKKTYFRASKFERVANVVDAAGGDVNKLKSGLQAFIRKSKNTRGFSNEEIEALRNAATNTGTEKLLKGLGRFGIDYRSTLTGGNVALPTLLGGYGALGHPGALAGVFGGTIANQLQRYIGAGKTEQLLQLIEKGASPQVLKQAFATAGVPTTVMVQILGNATANTILRAPNLRDKIQSK